MTDVTTEIDLINSPGKLIVADLLKRLSDDATLAEIAEELQILVALRKSLIDSRAGRVTPHDEFMRDFAAEQER
jgi:hypothetical protein